jgi:hypothetical protein
MRNPERVTRTHISVSLHPTSNHSHLQHCGVSPSITTMSNLRAFCAILSREVDPEIKSWDFTVANLPQAKQTNAAGLVKCLSLVSSATRQEIVLRFESAPSNRVTRKEPLDKFLLISLTDFRLRWPAKSPDDPPRVATGRESSDYVTRLLTTGVLLNRVHYHFFGHSNSQLKSRSCFMYAASKEEISAKIEAMGDLSKLKSVGKKAKRIGLLFSSAEIALDLSPGRCRDINDIKRDEYVFTDGCGLISARLARQLAQRRNIIHRNKRYLPSVFQIRYRGYKGVLTLDPTLRGKEHVLFRESMRKFKDASDYSFAVVGKFWLYELQVRHLLTSYVHLCRVLQALCLWQPQRRGGGALAYTRHLDRHASPKTAAVP